MYILTVLSNAPSSHGICKIILNFLIMLLENFAGFQALTKQPLKTVWKLQPKITKGQMWNMRKTRTFMLSKPGLIAALHNCRNTDTIGNNINSSKTFLWRETQERREMDITCTVCPYMCQNKAATTVCLLCPLGNKPLGHGKHSNDISHTYVRKQDIYGLNK